MPRLPALRFLFVSLLLPLASCAYLGALGQVVQKPRVSVRSVDLTTISFEGLAANVVLAVENPNPIGLSLGSFGYDLTVDGHQFATGRVQNAVSLPARGQGTVTIPVGFRFVELAQALTSLFTKDQLPYAISTTLGFSTPVGMLQVPLSHQGTFPVPRLPSVSLGATRVVSLNVQGAALRADIVLDNPNGFPIPSIPLQFKAALDGNVIASGGAEAKELPAQGRVSVPLTFNVPFTSSLIGLAASFMKSSTVAFTFEGGMNLPGLVQPYRISQPIALR